MTLVIIVLIILALIYALLIKPRTSEKPDTEGLNVKYVLRGVLSGDYAENTISAFAECIKYGVGIELDVRMTKDKEAVVFHDEGMARMLGVKKRISDVNLDELKTWGVAGTSELVPTLKEALDFIGGRVPIIIHFQGMSDDVSLASRSVDVLDGYDGKFLIFSKNPYFLDWFRRYRSRFCRISYSTNNFKENEGGTFLAKIIFICHLENYFTSPDFFAYEPKYSKNFALNVCQKVFKSESMLIVNSIEEATNYQNKNIGVIINNIKRRNQQ